MDLKTFQGNFPPGERVPEKLRQLLKFQNRSRDWYSGHFELAAAPFPPKAWFDGDEEAARRFIAFGEGPDGSSYVFWLYDERTLANAPVVFFGSEGTDCGVLANSIADFFGLLAVGEGELGYSASRADFSGPEKPAERLDEFRRWLRQEFGIEPPAKPMEEIRAARKKHPDLQKWLHKRQKSHFGE